MTTDGASMYSSSLLTSAPPAPADPPISSPPVTAQTTPPPVAPQTPPAPTVSAAAAVASAAAAAAAASQVQVSPSQEPKAVQPVAAAHAPAPQMAPMAAAAFGGYAQQMVFTTTPDASAVMDDQPTYVNPKQYARILKRRESRKKQTGTDVTSYTPRKRSYMHESRHKHAMQRRRGPGGRFLSKEEREAMNGKEAAAAGQ